MKGNSPIPVRFKATKAYGLRSACALAGMQMDLQEGTPRVLMSALAASCDNRCQLLWISPYA